ncbi:MAG TPA: HAD-IIB family hydrolase [Dissulfurispiraceae bacterium]|nr:HAD-IIB family hydrolase [Dissulfurispiraceae bacterium]
MPDDRKYIIFSDLDGTLLDQASYSFGPAKSALRLLAGRSIPVVLCSSKTKAEIEHYRKAMGNAHPFIAENGGGIYIPDGYFEEALYEGLPPSSQEGSYRTFSLGASYAQLRQALQKLKEEGFSVEGFGDMSINEIVRITGLPRRQAALASQRRYDEPFILDNDSPELRSCLRRAVARLRLRLAEGELLHLTGDNDKGKAVRILSTLFMRSLGPKCFTVALGDSPNDLPMFENVSFSFLVRKPGGFHHPAVQAKNMIRIDEAGPKGWAEAIERLLSSAETEALPQS